MPRSRRGSRWIVSVLLAACAGAAFASTAGARTRSLLAPSQAAADLWLVSAGGHVESLGGAEQLTPSGDWRRRRAVAAAADPSGHGLWILASNGDVVPVGDASSFGTAAASQGGRGDAVGIAATPDGGGYLVAFEDGRVEAFGDAVAAGNATLPRGERHGVVAIAVTPSGKGYWLVGADGQIYAFGDAANLPSPRSHGGPVVAAASTPTGGGLWLATADGRILAVGDATPLPAPRRGSEHGEPAALAATPSGLGLWVASEEGSVSAVGDAAEPARVRDRERDGRIVAVLSSVPTGSLSVTVSDLPSGAAALAAATGAGVDYGIAGTTTLRVPAGAYEIDAQPVHATDTTYYATLSGSPAQVAPGGTAAAVVDYYTAIPDTTEVLSPGSIEGATGDPATGLTLTLDAATAPAIAVGDIVAAGITPATPDGVLGTVVAVTLEGGTLTVETTPARLLDAVARGRLELDGSLPASQTHVRTTKAAAAHAQSAGSVLLDISRNIDCGVDDPVAVTGSVSVGVDVHLDADWGGPFHPLSVSSASFTGTVSESARLALSARAAAQCSLSPTPLLTTPVSWTFETFVGVIPVVARAELQIELSGSGKIDAAVETSVTQTLSATAGIGYDHGSFSPIADFQNSFDYEPPAPTASVSLEAKVGPQLSLLIYGLAGPSANLDTGLDFEADLTADPGTPWWTLYGTLDGGAGFIVPLLDIAWYDHDLFSVRHVLAQATEPPPADGGGSGDGGGDGGGGTGGGGDGGGGNPPPPPTLAVSPGSAAPGDTVSVTGAHFGANETVDLVFGHGGPRVGAPRADGSGAFSTTVTVPADAFGGIDPIVGAGETDGDVAEAAVTVIPPAAPAGGGAACNATGDSPGPGGGPANDDFSSAALLSGSSGSVTGTLVGATLQAGEAGASSPAQSSAASASVWYCFVPPASGDYTFSTSGSWVLPDGMSWNWWTGHDDAGEPPMLTAYAGTDSAVDWSTVSGGWAGGGVLGNAEFWNHTWDVTFNGPWDQAPSGSEELGWTTDTVTLEAGHPYLIDVDNGDWGGGAAPGSFVLSWGPADVDGDGAPSATDNCPATFNPDQANTYHGDVPDLGDACSPQPILDLTLPDSTAPASPYDMADNYGITLHQGSALDTTYASNGYVLVEQPGTYQVTVTATVTTTPGGSNLAGAGVMVIPYYSMQVCGGTTCWFADAPWGWARSTTNAQVDGTFTFTDTRTVTVTQADLDARTYSRWLVVAYTYNAGFGDDIKGTVEIKQLQAGP